MAQKPFCVLCAVAAMLAAPCTAALAQPRESRATIRWTGPPPEPPCVYKSAMSDAEIEACTRRPVHYDYRVLRQEKASAAQ